MTDKNNGKIRERSDITIEYYVSEIIEKDSDIFDINHNALCNIICKHYNLVENIKDIYDSQNEKVKENIISKVKGNVLKFTLNKENSNYFVLTDIDYLRFLLMQYINNPIHVREKIIFKKNFELIEEAIKKNVKLCVLKDYEEIIIEPYFVSVAKNETANYLFAYRYHNNKDFANYYIYRISNLEIIDIIDEQQKFKDIEIIKEAKKDFHPWKSFLWEEITATVQFTVFNAKEILKKYTNNRPKYKLIDEDEHIYEFTATEEQLKAYLLPLFNKTLIIEPYELRRWMWDEINDVRETYKYEN